MNNWPLRSSAPFTAKETSLQGTPVSYIRSTFGLETGECLCLFFADDAAQVKALDRKDGIPFDKVAPAMDLTPP